MSTTAPSISTSLLALGAACLLAASMAWGAPGERPPGPAPAPAAAGAPVVAYLPGADPAVDAAVLRGLRRGLAGTGVVLRVGARARAWSNAAPEAVRLVCALHARVLVTPPDRRIAHLMAQVATRTQTPVLSTSAARTVGATGSFYVTVLPEAAVPHPVWEAVGRAAAAAALGHLHGRKGCARRGS